MRLLTTFDTDLTTLLADDLATGERAITSAIRGAGTDLKTAWRAQITGAGLGQRLANSIRSQAYPRSGTSLEAAALIWSRAPVIVGAHETGPVIRSKDGFWLAIPTPAAGRSTRGGRITPLEWERRTGLRLRFVYRAGGPSLLVADEARVNVRGQAARKGGRRRKDGILTGAQTVVIFLLVPQVRLRKRLDLARDAERIAASLPDRIRASWE